MALTKIDDRGLKTPVDLLDNEKIRFGTGNDLEIYHEGGSGHSIINNKTNDLKLYVKDGENAVWCKADGGVELYYDNSKKFETTSYGSAHTGIMRFENSGDGISFYDSRELKFGDGDDLKIYHTGTLSRIDNNTGDLLIRTNVASDVGGNIYLKPHDDEDGIIIIHDAGVELYYDGSKKFETHAAGIKAISTTNECNLLLQNDARTWKIVNYDYSGSGGDHLGFHDGTADRLIIQNDGHVHLPADDQKLVFGTGDDLEIYHDASDSYIKDTGTGSLKLCSNAFKVMNAANNEAQIYANENGAVELYYDNSKKLETTTNGIAVTGRIEPTDHIFMDASYGIAFDPYGAGGSNLFDDYEEGTFTATLTATDLTLSSNTYTCYYTKVGRLVVCNGYAQGTTPANISGYSADASHGLGISGLPYTILNAIGARGVASIGVGNGFSVTNNYYTTSHGENNSSSIALWQNPNSAGTRIGHVLTASTEITFHWSFSYSTT